MKRFVALVLSLVMALSLCAPAWGADPVEVSDEAGVVAAFVNGGTYKLTKSVAMAENTRLIVDNGVSVTLDLGGNTLSSTNTATAIHNFFIDVKGGTLTISNGAVEYMHTGTNMGWNGATEVFDVTAGGVLNMSGVTAKISGTDMNFAVHMNNWGEVTLNVQNSYLKATYMPVRVFNSGPDMNNVTIENSTLDGGSHSFWVHNYTSADFGGKVYSNATAAYDEAAVAARLNFDIYGNGNTFITGKPYPVRYGFTGSTYFTSEGISSDVVAKVGNEYYKSLAEAVAAADGKTVTLLTDIDIATPVEPITGWKAGALHDYGTIDGANYAFDATFDEDVFAGLWTCDYATGVKNLKITSDARAALAVQAQNNKTTIENVTVTANGAGIHIEYGDAGVVLKNNTVKTTADNAYMTDAGVKAAIFVGVGSDVTVESGTYEGAQYALHTGGTNNSTVTITGGNFKGDINVLAGDTLVIKGGYFTVDPSAYCDDGLTGVTSDKAGYLYMVGEKKAASAEVDVAAPVVSADKVDTTNTTVNNVVNTIGGTSGVEIDNAALMAAAVGAANENKVTPTVQQAEALDDLITNEDVTVNDVAIVVQTYFDVEIEKVKVDETTNKATSITVDITPMQQTVATTEDVVESNADIEVGENAVKVGNPVPVKITEPVDITLKLPSTCFAVGDKVYITHQASVGTVIYEATVAADYTITFTTTHGFSPFTISASDPGVKASVGTDNYADLQSAINYAGKDATIVVKASGQTAVVKSETSFTVTTDAGVSDPTISAGAGYKMVKETVTGGVKYTFTKNTYPSGNYPYNPTPSTKPVQSAQTFDAGIGLYIGMSVLAATGSAVVLKKKD